MTVLVLGGTGMLGHKMFQFLSKRFPDTICTIRGRVDDEPLRHIDLFQTGRVIENVNALDYGSLERALRELRPQVIVNCTGIIKQRKEAKAAIPSIALNALLPHRLAETCAGWGGRLVHFSTDCVFSGKRGCYQESDLPDAEDLYGRTKFLGEVVTENALTLRTSMVGRELMHHESLLEWFLAQNLEKIKGFKHVFFSGVTTNHLAEVVGWLIEHYPKLWGLYQVASQTISKYELLCLFRAAYGLDIEIVPDETCFSDRSIDGEKFRQATGYVSPPWSILADQLANDHTPYDSWRS